MCETRVSVVGVGSALMTDDGVGLRAVELLARRGVPPGVELIDAGLALSDVLGRLDPAAPLVIIDAVRANGPPGGLYRFTLDPETLDAATTGPLLSLHELSVLPALRLEAVSGRVFSDVTVFGVEPARLEWGDALSPEVAAGLDRLVDAVLEHLKSKCAHSCRRMS